MVREVRRPVGDMIRIGIGSPAGRKTRDVGDVIRDGNGLKIIGSPAVGKTGDVPQVTASVPLPIRRRVNTSMSSLKKRPQLSRKRSGAPRIGKPILPLLRKEVGSRGIPSRHPSIKALGCHSGIKEEASSAHGKGITSSSGSGRKWTWSRQTVRREFKREGEGGWNIRIGGVSRRKRQQTGRQFTTVRALRSA